MPAACIAIVASGLVHTLPAPALTLAWTHSVEHTRWEEDYVIRGERLAIREARVQASGAGMEPGAGAVFSNGWWRYAPQVAPLEEVVLANSAFVAGYTLCWPGGGCRPLDRLVPRGEPATLRVAPCSPAA